MDTSMSEHDTSTSPTSRIRRRAADLPSLNYYPFHLPLPHRDDEYFTRVLLDDELELLKKYPSEDIPVEEADVPVEHDVPAEDDVLSEASTEEEENIIKKKHGFYELMDIVWLKHDKKSCYWPAYVIAIENKMLSALRICYNKFTKDEETSSYPVQSRKLKPFNLYDEECLRYIEAGRKFCESSTLKDATLKNFDEAVNLAQIYVRERADGNEALMEEEDVFKFFHDRAFDFYHQLCIQDHQHKQEQKMKASSQKQPASEQPCSSSSSSVSLEPTPPLQPPPQPVNVRKSRRITIKEKKFGRKSYLFKEDNPPKKKKKKNPETAGSSDNTPAEVLSMPLPLVRDRLCVHVAVDADGNSISQYEMTEKKKRERDIQQATIGLANFHKKGEILIEYILGGNCDQLLTDIYNEKIPSERLMNFRRVWNDENPAQCHKSAMKLMSAYFRSHSQISKIALYCSRFAAALPGFEKEREALSPALWRTKLGKFSMVVFYPHAVIAAIGHCFRRGPERAEKAFMDGYRGPSMPVDPSSEEPLSEELVQRIEYRIRKDAERLGIEI